MDFTNALLSCMMMKRNEKGKGSRTWTREILNCWRFWRTAKTLYQFPDILAEYHRRFPRVRLQITTDQSRNLYRQMVEGSLDAAIIRGDYNWDGARFLLSRERVCVICARGLEEIPLKSQIYIGRKTDSALETATLRWMNEQGLDGIHTGLSVDSIITCVEMVRRGLGWSVVPEIALKSFEGCIRPCVFENGEPFVRDTTLTCRGESLRLPQVKAFVEQLKQPEAGLEPTTSGLRCLIFELFHA